MSLGLKEVLSTNTDFVSRKDDSLEVIYDNSENRSYYEKLRKLFVAENTIDKDWTFSGSEKNEEIEKVAKALVEQEIAPLAGVTEVEDLSKEAQTIFSDIVAWMLERKMRDHEGTIAKDNENAEWRESVAELTTSVVSTLRSFAPFFQNKEHRTEYRKRFLKEKEDLLKKYAQTELPPLMEAQNILEIENDKLKNFEKEIEEKRKFNKCITSCLDQLHTNVKTYCDPLTLEAINYDELIKFLVSQEQGYDCNNCKKFSDCISSVVTKFTKLSQSKEQKSFTAFTEFKTMFNNESNLENKNFDEWKSVIRGEKKEILDKLNELEKNCNDLKLNEEATEELNQNIKTLDQEILDINDKLVRPKELKNELNQWFSGQNPKHLEPDPKEELKSKFDFWTKNHLVEIDNTKLKQELYSNHSSLYHYKFTLTNSNTQDIQTAHKRVQGIIDELIKEKEKLQDEKNQMNQGLKTDKTLKETEQKEHLKTNNSIKDKLIKEVDEAINLLKKELKKQIDQYIKKIQERRLLEEQDTRNLETDIINTKELIKNHEITIQHIKDLEGKLPWTTKILPGSSGSNTIYKIEYVLGGGEPPIVIEEFSFPTQKGVRSRNAAIAKRLILLLSAQKPVEEEDKTESQISQNAPNLAEVLKQIAFLGKTGVRVYKTSKASSDGRKKRAFARAADCYGAIPVVLRATLASLEAGFAFNKEITREAIK